MARKAWLAATLGLLIPFKALAAPTTTIRYINTDCSDNGDGTAATCAASPGGAGAYTSCTNAEDDIDGDFPDLTASDRIIRIRGKGTAVDSTQCVFQGITTDSTRYVVIENETGSSNYTIQGNDFSAIQINGVRNIRILGIKIKSNLPTAGEARGIVVVSASNGDIRIEGNTIWQANAATGTSRNGIEVWSGNSGLKLRISNNIIYGFANVAMAIDTNGDTGREMYVYNNTTFNNKYGLSYNCSGTSVIAKIKDNLLQESTTTDYIKTAGTCGTLTTSKNTTSDTSSPDGATYQSKHASFISTSGGSENLHLRNADTVGKDTGDNLTGDSDYAISTDIDGDTRPIGAASDIGADEQDGSPDPTTTTTTSTTTSTTSTTTTTTIPPFPPDYDIPANDIDEDENGSDNLIEGSNDKDFDGSIDATTDCDSSDWKIRNGTYVTCMAGTGWKQCVNGSYTSCTLNAVTPLCEATGGGHCYYVDAVDGNDTTGNGSYSSPWKTAKCVSFYGVGGDTPPSCHVNLAAKDVVYFFTGDYNTLYNPGGGWSSEVAVADGYLAGTSGSPITWAAYPGETPVFKTRPFRLFNVQYVNLRGLSMTEASKGIDIYNSGNLDLDSLHVYENHGSENDNDSGINIAEQSFNVNVHHSRIHDNYEIGPPSGGLDANDRAIVLFKGYGNRISYNRIWATNFYTDTESRTGCIGYKHGSDDVRGFEADHNILWNCANVAIGSGTAYSKVHHNLIFTSAAGMVFTDLGGDTWQRNEQFYNNLVILTGSNAFALNLYASSRGDAYVYDNIFVDGRTYSPGAGAEDGVIKVHHRDESTEYADYIQAGYFHSTGNCFFNSADDFQADLMGCSPEGPSTAACNAAGGIYNYTQYCAALGCSDFVENPELDVHWMPQSTNCTGKGPFSVDPPPVDVPEINVSNIPQLIDQLIRRYRGE